MESSDESSGSVRVLLALGKPEREQQLRDALVRQGFTIATRSLDAPGMVERAADCDVALVSSDLHRLSPGALRAARETGIPVVLLVSTTEMDRYRGLAHLLPEDAALDDIAAALRQGSDRGSSYEARSAPEEIGPTFPKAEAGQEQGGQLIALVSGKGAPGVTTLAIALAHVLARSKQAVALMDADLRGGNVAAYLDLDPRRGLVGLTLEGADRAVDKLIADELQEARGFSVLAGLERGEFQERMSAERLAAAIAVLRQRFPYVLVDVGELVPGRLATLVHPLLREADQVLLVTKPDLVALWNARTALQYLNDNVGRPTTQSALLLNGREGSDQYGAPEVEMTLGLPVVAEVKADRRAGQLAIREQAPITEFSGAIGKVMGGLAVRLTGVEAPPVEHRGRWTPRWPWAFAPLGRRQ